MPQLDLFGSVIPDQPAEKKVVDKTTAKKPAKAAGKQATEQPGMLTAMLSDHLAPETPVAAVSANFESVGKHAQTASPELVPSAQNEDAATETDKIPAENETALLSVPGDAPTEMVLAHVDVQQFTGQIEIIDKPAAPKPAIQKKFVQPIANDNRVVFEDENITVKIKRKPEPVKQPETKPAKDVKTPQKRGRKSFKEIDAEVDLIEVPDDETLFQKQYYAISEVAKWFRVNTSLLRFWENEFDST